jgi:hypothetical protein
MPKFFVFLFVILLLPFLIQAQQSAYFNHTEIGTTFGGTKAYETFTPRLNFTFESFNGVMLNPRHAMGISLGYDTYPGLDLIPFSLGWRGFHDRGGRINFFAATNLGYGSAILMKRENTEFEERRHEGGLMYSAAIGVRKKARKNPYAFTWSIGYKRQQTYHHHSYLAPFFSGFSSFWPASGKNVMIEEIFTFNSLMLKWGFQF